MDKLAQALDALEAAGQTGSGDLMGNYRTIRPHLEKVAAALSGMGGDHARVAQVLENLMAGADTIATGGVVPQTAKTPGAAAQPTNSV